MTRLSEVTALWGDAALRDEPLELTTYPFVSYVPFRPTPAFPNEAGWGLYDRDGRLIPSAAYRRGPDSQLIGQSESCPFARGDMDFVGEDVLYGGPMLLHYGHFVIASLARLWGLHAITNGRIRILCHAEQSPGHWFIHPHVQAILGALGLTEDNFLWLDRPSILRSVIVPGPAIEEQSFVHRSFDDVAYAVARRLGIRSEQRTERPVYLSKTRLSTGINRFAGEQALEDALGARGFSIVHPQELTFAHQIQVLARAKAVTGTVGSGLHSTMFLTDPARVVGLLPTNMLNSNFKLIDMLRGNDSSYLYPDTALAPQHHQGGFHSSWTGLDMAAIAQDFADRV